MGSSLEGRKAAVGRNQRCGVAGVDDGRYLPRSHEEVDLQRVLRAFVVKNLLKKQENTNVYYRASVGRSQKNKPLMNTDAH